MEQTSATNSLELTSASTRLKFKRLLPNALNSEEDTFETQLIKRVIEDSSRTLLLLSPAYPLLNESLLSFVADDSSDEMVMNFPSTVGISRLLAELLVEAPEFRP